MSEEANMSEPTSEPVGQNVGTQPESPAVSEAAPAEPAGESEQEQRHEEERKPEERKPSRTLLDDEEEPAKGEPEAASGAPTAEDVEKFCKGIPATDLGDGVTWSDDTLRAMAPSLMELTGGDPSKANGVVKAYSSYMQELSRKQQEAAEAFNDGQLKECRKRFGDDLPKVAKAARVAGRAIFGDALWNALKATPEFANNPDVLERLAEHGRRISQDGGAVRPVDGTPSGDGGDVLHRMYGNVKVG